MEGGRVLKEFVKMLRKLLDQYRASVIRVRGAVRAGRALRMLRVELEMCCEGAPDDGRQILQFLKI